MFSMPQIIAACITGFFMFIAIMVQNILLSRRRKIEDVASAIIPKRAELYRELIQKICDTGIQYRYENDTPRIEKIAFLHETCNRAIYELCPYASLNVLNAITKLSEICANHRKIITDIDDSEMSEKWNDFKQDFKFYFAPFVTLVRFDCLSNPINDIFEDKKRTKDLIEGSYPEKVVLKRRKRAEINNY